jgi:galactoside O-acetyltransferase
MIARFLRKKVNHLLGNDHSKLLKRLIQSGNLVAGEGTQLDQCKMFSLHAMKPGFANVKIGNDCILEGRIILFSPEARITIGDRVYIGPGTSLYCYESIEIGNDIMFSWDITVLDTNAHSLQWNERKNDVINWKKGAAFKDWSVVQHEKVVVKDKAWIGFNSILLKGVTVGEGAVVAAGSVVAKDVEDFTVVGGNPAQFIKKTS